jgi:hypothetical protein
MIRQLVTPPRSPKDCVFALTTQTLSAELKTKIVPLSIRRESGLRFVRMRRIHGLASCSSPQAGRHHPCWSHLQSLNQDWPSLVQTDYTHAATHHALFAGAHRTSASWKSR